MRKRNTVGDDVFIATFNEKNRTVSDEHLTDIFTEVGRRYGYDDVAAEFGDLRDFKCRWQRSYNWIRFVISDYLDRAPDEVLRDLAEVLFAKITGATGIANAGSAATLQAACATVWGKLAQKFEDEDVTPVFFLNPLDVAAYLGTATITTQNAFGVSYLENFLGLGNAIITASVAQGTVFGTVAENLNGACADVNGEGNDLFGFTADATGLVAMKHSVEDTSLAVNTIAYSAVTFYPELVDGIVKATISTT